MPSGRGKSAVEETHQGQEQEGERPERDQIGGAKGGIHPTGGGKGEGGTTEKRRPAGTRDTRSLQQGAAEAEGSEAVASHVEHKEEIGGANEPEDGLPGKREQPVDEGQGVVHQAHANWKEDKVREERRLMAVEEGETNPPEVPEKDPLVDITANDVVGPVLRERPGEEEGQEQVEQRGKERATHRKEGWGAGDRGPNGWARSKPGSHPGMVAQARAATGLPRHQPTVWRG